jgi:hypothetical protein
MVPLDVLAFPRPLSLRPVLNVVERGAASEMVKWKTVFFNTAVLESKLILAWK